jgi:tryptophan synthase beta chain
VERFINLRGEDIPKYWYNVKADLPFDMDPPLDPQTMKPMDPSKLEVLFPKALVMQEGTKEKEIEIPQKVREAYALYRPTPLVRAFGFEKALKTPAHIYYKNESVSPTGSHKLNTALAQAYYNLEEGINKISTSFFAKFGQFHSFIARGGFSPPRRIRFDARLDER